MTCLAAASESLCALIASAFPALMFGQLGFLLVVCFLAYRALILRLIMVLLLVPGDAKMDSYVPAQK